MLALVISGVQTTTEATSQMRDINGRNELEKITNMFFTDILRMIVILGPNTLDLI